MTLQESQTMKSEQLDTLTLSAEDFRAKLSALRELEEDSKILEELYFLRLQGSLLFSNLSIYSLKTLKDSSTMTRAIPLRQSSQRWMDSGMMWNGKCLTAKISESLKIGERVFIVGHLREGRTRNVFPILRENAKSDNQQSKIEIIGNTKNPNGTRKGTGSIVYNSNGLVGTLLARDYKEPKQIAIPNEIKKFGVLQPNFNQSGVVYETDGISPTIRCYGGGGLEPKIRVKEATKQGYAEAEVGDSINLSHPNSKTRRGRVGKQIANTLLTGESQGVVEPDFRIRKLTPRECWRLQGFPDWAFDKAQEVNSNSQLYKQAGNSVTVNVIAAIAERL